jgi:hypothetical protein
MLSINDLDCVAAYIAIRRQKDKDQ